MAESNAELCRRAYAAFSSGDMDTLTELIAPDVAWIVGGRNRLARTYHGRDATFEYFATLLEATDGSFEIELLTATEIVPDTVLVTAQVTAQVRGVTFDEQVVQQFHLRQGQAIACRTFAENGYLWDDLIGPATITLPTQAVREATTAP